MRSSYALIVVPLLAACAHPAATTIDGMLQRSRAASGGGAWDAVGAVETDGSIATGGMTGEYHTLDDVHDGRRVARYAIGPLVGAEGFDGTAPWAQDPGGEVEAHDAPEAIALARTMTWLVVHGYFRAEGARWREVGPRQDGGRSFRVVEAVPDGGVPIELWFDDARGLLARTVHREGSETVVTTFDDYRDVQGVQLAFRTVIDPGDVRNRMTIVVGSARLRGPLAAEEAARPATSADKVAYLGGARRTEVPFDLVNNHIYVHAQVDGQPVLMLVDTGGLNVLTPAAAKRLGLTPEGKMAAGGVGAEKVDLALARGKRLRVGDIEVADPTFYVIDTGDLLDIEGVDLDGLVGFELFHRFAVRIDYPAGKLTLEDPATFVPPTGATAVPFTLRDRTPIVAGAIDGIAATFVVDTGSRVSLTTASPFSRANDLKGKYKPRFEAITGWGVGGPTRSWPVRFGEVSIGGVTVHGVAGDLFLGDKGSFADPDASANLGGGILHRFIVTFDYGRRVMYLEPGPDVAARDGYDRFGAWLMRSGAALRIRALTAGGPAERAGLQADDLVVAIDGAPVSQHTLPEWRARFRDGAVGTRLVLTIERGGQRRDVPVVLEELLP